LPALGRSGTPPRLALHVQEKQRDVRLAGLPLVELGPVTRWPECAENFAPVLGRCLMDGSGAGGDYRFMSRVDDVIVVRVTANAPATRAHGTRSGGGVPSS
jgi:hypothetical protein